MGAMSGVVTALRLLNGDPFNTDVRRGTAVKEARASGTRACLIVVAPPFLSPSNDGVRRYCIAGGRWCLWSASELLSEVLFSVSDWCLAHPQGVPCLLVPTCRSRQCWLSCPGSAGNGAVPARPLLCACGCAVRLVWSVPGGTVSFGVDDHNLFVFLCCVFACLSVCLSCLSVVCVCVFKKRAQVQATEWAWALIGTVLAVEVLVLLLHWTWRRKGKQHSRSIGNVVQDPLLP